MIVRTTAPQATVAGGVVLDPAPPRHGGDASARSPACACSPAATRRSLVRAALRGAALAARRSRRSRRPACSTATRRCAALAELAAGRAAASSPGAEPTWLTAARYDELRAGAREQLDAARRRAPARARRCPRSAVVARRARSPMPCSRGSPPTACSSATARTCCSPGARAERAGGARGRGAAPCSPRSPTAASRRPTCRRCRPPRDCPSASSRRSAPRSSATGSIVRFGGDLAYTGERFAEARELVSRAAPSTARSRWPSCATTSAPAGGSPRACSSGSTPTASRAASATAACCGGARRPDRSPDPAGSRGDAGRTALEALARLTSAVAEGAAHDRTTEGASPWSGHAGTCSCSIACRARRRLPATAGASLKISAWTSGERLSVARDGSAQITWREAGRTRTAVVRGDHVRYRATHRRPSRRAARCTRRRLRRRRGRARRTARTTRCSASAASASSGSSARRSCASRAGAARSRSSR